MASRLSEDELRRALLEMGDRDVGPITPTTRGAMERRLAKLRRTRAPLNALSSDDSEIEGGASPTRKKRSAPTRRPSETFKKPPSPSRAPPKRTTTKKSRASTFEVDTSDSEFDTPKLRRRHLASLPDPSKRRDPLAVGPAPPNHLYTPTLERLNKAPSNGFLARDIGEADRKELQGHSADHSHCISWLIPSATILFFLVIGLLYMSEVQRNSPTKHYSKFCTGVNEEQCEPLLLVSKNLHYSLTKVAGDYECGYTSARDVSTSDVRAHIKDLLTADDNFKMEQFEEIFDRSLLLFLNNPQWGVKCHSNGRGGGMSSLEAEHSSKSLLCRAKMALALTLTKLLLLVSLCGLVGVSYLAWCLWKRRREAQEKLFYEMVERVIDMQSESSAEESGNCRAVVNIRDALIPAKKRKSLEWLWDRVVRFIEENESRVSVEFHTIHGEEFKVWRWNTPAENQGKVWQGKAFSSPEKGTFTPTPCLKIRNMFDPAVEYGSDWQASVKDAILEKYKGNGGILHIAIDSTSNSEGCIYMMCNSSEAAGKAFDDLHGWWFNGKLVTVKYLKQSRYLERFPDSAHLSCPLRPSNDRRLSLSTPFFSSALERS